MRLAVLLFFDERVFVVRFTLLVKLRTFDVW